MGPLEPFTHIFTGLAAKAIRFRPFYKRHYRKKMDILKWFFPQKIRKNMWTGNQDDINIEIAGRLSQPAEKFLLFSVHFGGFSGIIRFPNLAFSSEKCRFSNQNTINVVPTVDFSGCFRYNYHYNFVRDVRYIRG